MPLKGKNELERFVDKFGYNKIWAALDELLSNVSSTSKTWQTQCLCGVAGFLGFKCSQPLEKIIVDKMLLL